MGDDGADPTLGIHLRRRAGDRPHERGRGTGPRCPGEDPRGDVGRGGGEQGTQEEEHADDEAAG